VIKVVLALASIPNLLNGRQPRILPSGQAFKLALTKQAFRDDVAEFHFGREGWLNPCRLGLGSLRPCEPVFKPVEGCCTRTFDGQNHLTGIRYPLVSFASGKPGNTAFEMPPSPGPSIAIAWECPPEPNSKKISYSLYGSKVES
jgi:hypothetical protein